MMNKAGLILIHLIAIVSQGEYIGEIKGGLRPSMKLVVMGIINKKPKRLVYTPVSILKSEKYQYWPTCCCIAAS